MPRRLSRRWDWLISAAFLLLMVTPEIARAGDAPLYTVGDWGIGTIDNCFIFYLGHDHYLPTPIPSTPKFVTTYAFIAGVLAGGLAVRFYLRREFVCASRRRGFEAVRRERGVERGRE